MPNGSLKAGVIFDDQLQVRRVSTKQTKVGFPLIGGGEWQGGLNYQRSLLKALFTSDSEIIAQVFVPPGKLQIAEKYFSDVVTLPIVEDRRALGAGRGLRLAGALITGRDGLYRDLMNEYEVDVVFESATYLGWRFPLHKLIWIPDFQHLKLPKFFTLMQWLRREVGYRLQLETGGNYTLIVSSDTAQKDCFMYYKRCQGRTRVLKFVSILNDFGEAETPIELDGVRLDNGFFFLPNQYWKHKNHEVVVNALKYLSDNNLLADLPPILMTGDSSDFRSSGLFEAHKKQVRRDQLSEWFCHLGKVPYDLIQRLHKDAIAVINPSLFEGWSTSVEEAKTFQSRLILSDIAVHREQAPAARFFNPLEAGELGQILYSLQDKRGPPNRDWLEIESSAGEAQERFSNDLVNIIRESAQSR